MAIQFASQSILIGTLLFGGTLGLIALTIGQQ
jgi:hypothetical protein